jgi:hypothetical protein
MKLKNPFNGPQMLRFGVVATLSIGVLATAAGRGTLAFFTTQVTSNANTFTAGTLRLAVGDLDDAFNDGTPTAASASITFANMKPGDVVYAPIEIRNTGTLNAVYGIKYTTTTTGQDLAPGLALAIRGTGAGGTGTNATTTLNANACNATSFASAVPGTVWPEAVRTAAAMVATTGETIQAVASPATGFAVASLTGVDILCLQVAFTEPGSASNTYNNAVNGATNTTVTFTFDGLVGAAAVINNP